MIDLNLGDTQLILSVCRDEGALRNQAAYILATAHWETGRAIKPIKETVMPHHKDKNPSDATVKTRLTKAWKKGQLKWVKSDYWSTGFFGRGYVQLTHDYNYVKAGSKLGLDLANNPSDVMEPHIAAKILVRGSLEGWFTGKKLADYITLTKSDFRNARRVINGTDRAAEIAAIAEKYDAALKSAGYGKTTPAITEPATNEKPSCIAGIFAAIIAAIFGKAKT